ncbi:cell surface A33 antigen-like [Astyanax mexicanus]|uniref:cell surface A33 antigen-like n=1 Tax=Astyanax mexicanus TaxID=7994 RepID=UPI0020CAACC2|nr:cell surface A33 antigen-like [Astyanax mexicanus]
MLNFYLLFIVLHVSEGCILVNSGRALSITAHTGESVLLPCSCTDLNSTPDTFTWEKHNTISNRYEEISSESDQYRNRVQLFNNLSPANLSLLISHLTEEDDGWYRCKVKHGEYTDIRLSVKDCSLVNRGEILSINAHTGESVLLPCSCTDLNSTPDTFSWRKLNTISNRWENISSESDQYRNRVQLFNNLSPANLSLLISHLTEEDAGDYRCNIKHGEFRDIRLTVKVTAEVSRQTSSTTPITSSSPRPSATPNTLPPAEGQRQGQMESKDQKQQRREKDTQDQVTYSTIAHSNTTRQVTVTDTEENTEYATIRGSPHSLPFVPFALATVIFLHIIVAVVYCTKRTKGALSYI